MMKHILILSILATALAACTPPEVEAPQEDAPPEPVPLSVPLATG